MMNIPDFGLLTDEDDGVAEALRRANELKANPAIGLTGEELENLIAQQFDIPSSTDCKP